jgi:hypothetical protein
MWHLLYSLWAQYATSLGIYIFQVLYRLDMRYENLHSLHSIENS